MSQCTNGSSPLPGSPAWFTYTETDLANFLPPVFGFVTYGAMGIPAGPQETAAFCAAEPVGDLPTTLDYALLAVPALALAAGTYQRFGNQVRQSKFADLCQCSTPGSLTCLTPGLTTGSYTGFGCSSGDESIGFRFTALVDRFQGWYVYGSTSVTVSGTLDLWDTTSTGSPVATSSISGVAPNTRGHATITPIAITPGRDYVVSIRKVNTSCYVGRGGAAVPSVASYYTGVDQVYNASGFGYPATGSLGVQPGLEPDLCNTGGVVYPYTDPPALTPPSGYPSPPTGPTCTTQQDICDFMARIDTKLNLIDLEVNNLQRFGAPMAYTLGVASTGLTGTGVVSASGILGALVQLITIPGTWGSTMETPERLIPTAVTIQAQTADGYTDWFPVHYDPQMIMFSTPWATGIRYNVKAGFVATITPLLAPL